jgi:Tol biopolymer transport system component
LVAQPFDVHKAELGGQPTPLPDHPALVGPNSAAMFSASDTGLLVYYPNVFGSLGWDLTWHDRSGKRLGSIGQDFFALPSISPDATKVAAGVFDPTWWTPDLWIIDLARRTKTRFTFGPGSSGGAVWQPDGQAIIYGRSTSGTIHIYRKELNGKNPEPLLETNGVNESPRSVCHDSRYLAYSREGRTPQARSEVWILPLFGDRKPFPLVQSEFDSTEAAFSPDCKWLAFRSTDPGQPEVYVTSFPDGGRKYQVSTGGGVTPYWRADGKEMFFFDPQTANIMAVNVEESGGKLQLGTPHALFQAPGIGYRLGIFAASPDGQRFLVNGDPPTMSAVSAVPLTLVSNWLAQLKK